LIQARDPGQLPVQIGTAIEPAIDVRRCQQHDSGRLRKPNILQLESWDRPKERLKLPSRFRVEQGLPLATDCFGDKSQAVSDRKHLFRVYDVLIDQQIDGDCRGAAFLRSPGTQE
jgi:hypothetical protein